MVVDAHAQLTEGQLEDAEYYLTKALKYHSNDPMLVSLSGLLYAARGQKTQAEEAFARAENHAGAELHPHHIYHLMACGYSLLGDIKLALHWLQRTANEGMPCYPWFVQDPMLEALRDSEEGKEFFSVLARRFRFFETHFPEDDPATMELMKTIAN